MAGEYLQTAEVAAEAERSSERVRQAVRRGELRPAIETAMGFRLFARAEVLRWIATLPKRNRR